VQCGLVDFFSSRPPRRLGTTSVSKTIQMSSLRPGTMCSEVIRIYALRVHIFFHEFLLFRNAFLRSFPFIKKITVSGRMGSSAMMARADFVLYFVFFK
jgi:hypothetical protein